MKRKSMILLSSIMAGALLVGGAFALYAVTDNADPFGINVTPGELSIDGETTFVTLEWGANTQLNNVTHIEVGENRKVGVLELKTDEADYTGDLKIEIIDQTKGKSPTDKNLKDYLDVYLYTGDQNLVTPLGKEVPTDLPAATPVATIEAGSEEYSTTYESALGRKTGVKYSIFVTLNNSANPVYSQINEDVVFLRVDWSTKAADVESGKVVYFDVPTAWGEGTPKVYAWNGSVSNGDFPGLAMNHYHDRVYYAEVSGAMKNVIFSVGSSQTPDIELSGATSATSMYHMTSETAGEWTALIAPEQYYLVGIIKGEDQWSVDSDTVVFAPNTINIGEYYYHNLELDAGDELKAIDSVGNWYPASGGNYVITEDGFYDIYFKPTGNPDWGYYYLYVTPHAA